MRISAVIDPKLVDSLKGAAVAGVDVGSRQAKAIILKDDEIFYLQSPTGINMQKTADALLSDLLALSGLKYQDLVYIVGTGYGRVAMSFPEVGNQIVTEISCHALGVHYLDPEVRTIIDIGGQDSKSIKVDPDSGRVVSFVMNDKCAAGTGRFLEKVAQLLDLDLNELGPIALESKVPAEISSQCVVFAESEVVSLRAKGSTPADIAAGIHLATARRVKSLLSRVGIEPKLAFSGGVSNNVGMAKAIEDLVGYPVAQFKLDAVFAGALGAAIHARQFHADSSTKVTRSTNDHSVNLSDINNAVSRHQENIIAGTTGRHSVGYICSYTPLEILSAAGVNHIRLFKMGNTDIVASGEQITQSVFCDFTKSILGAFKEGVALNKAIEKTYTFYTCDCIKKVGEAIGDFFGPSEIYTLPRLRNKTSSRDYYRKEIINFKTDLEELTGRKIAEEDIKDRIKLYNLVRKTLKRISDLRKRDYPPLKGRDFLDAVKAFFYLPPDRLLTLYEDLYHRLATVHEFDQKPPIRLMMAGGIVADGDRRLLELVEDSLGARVVIEDHCTGARNVSFQLSETEDPYSSLAHGYLDQSPCTRMKPLEERIAISGQLAQEYRVDGILYVYLKFCPCYGQVKHEFFKHFQDLGIPVLEVALDYSASDQGQLKTRLEAFIEVLNERDRPLISQTA
ncbi:MAG: acyl-CoA dehydratase activase [Deltaproteobacteria bacterium]|jgi:predicted CoA-substrate-specific enzyme activase|nr:acyl-CoA dehydratase activase [Deltaproteobacteria bacterium]